jgi:hypothetical protein
MSNMERVTVTLSSDLLRDLDRRERNRSKFVAEAVRNELVRRRRAELRRSLQDTHPESASLARKGCVGHPHCIQVKRPAHSVLRATYLEAEQGLEEWVAASPSVGSWARAAMDCSIRRGAPSPSGLTKTSFALIDHLRSVDDGGFAAFSAPLRREKWRV